MGDLKAHMSRRGRKKDEADQIGACRKRDIERFGRLQAADLDQDGHSRRLLHGAVLHRGRRFVSPLQTFDIQGELAKITPPAAEW
jgi:hypothetical protein